MVTVVGGFSGATAPTPNWGPHPLPGRYYGSVAVHSTQTAQPRFCIGGLLRNWFGLDNGDGRRRRRLERQAHCKPMVGIQRLRSSSAVPVGRADYPGRPLYGLAWLAKYIALRPRTSRPSKSNKSVSQHSLFVVSRIAVASPHTVPDLRFENRFGALFRCAQCVPIPGSVPNSRTASVERQSCKTAPCCSRDQHKKAFQRPLVSLPIVV